MRVVVALGGNAMTGPDGSATPQAQRDAVEVAAGAIADVVAAGTRWFSPTVMARRWATCW